MIGRTDLGWATAYWHRMNTAFSISAESTCIKRWHYHFFRRRSLVITRAHVRVEAGVRCDEEVRFHLPLHLIPVPNSEASLSKLFRST